MKVEYLKTRKSLPERLIVGEPEQLYDTHREVEKELYNKGNAKEQQIAKTNLFD